MISGISLSGFVSWSGLPCPSPGDLPDLGIKPVSLTPPALAGGFFTTSATWEAQVGGWGWKLPPSSHLVFLVTGPSLRPSRGPSFLYFFHINSTKCSLRISSNSCRKIPRLLGALCQELDKDQMYIFKLRCSTLTSPTLLSACLTGKDHRLSLESPLLVQVKIR